jgi:DNA polymerase I-like protein with 3'-5' exonuclease and polymerase domains
VRNRKIWESTSGTLALAEGIELMKSAVILEVPMEVEVGIGKNWLEAH